MEKNFFNLIDPVTDYIDSGKFFRQPLQWLYYIIGVLCACAPLYLLYELIDNRFFKYAEGKEIFAVILIWIVLAAVCLGCFLLWFNRAKKLSGILTPGSKFVAVPAVANFIQTLGEFYGLFVGVFGFICCLLMALFDIDFYMHGLFSPSASVLSAIIMAITGYVVIIVTRYIAELVLSIADIANNTDRLVKK